MKAYYNEFDPKAAAWLRSLIEWGCQPSGTFAGLRQCNRCPVRPSVHRSCDGGEEIEHRALLLNHLPNRRKFDRAVLPREIYFGF